MRRFALACLFVALAAPAFACPSPLTGKDAAGATQNFGVTLDGSANCYGNVGLVDGSNAANKATVTAESALKVAPADHVATGTVTAVNNAVTVSTVATGSVTAIVSADTNVTLAFEGTVDGTNFVSLNAYPIGGGASVTTTSATGSWAIPSGGLNQVRLRVTAVGATPTATISLNAGAGSTQPNVVVNPTAANLNTTVTGTVTANQGTSPWVDSVTGNVASASADSGNPVKVGCVAHTALPTAGADGNRFDCMADKFGRLAVVMNGDRALATTGTVTVSTTTETTLLAAGGAGVFLDVTHLSCTNTSATLVRVDIRDATAGTIRFSRALAASGGGFVDDFNMPFPQAVANNNWTVQLSAAVTDVRCDILAMKNK